LGELKAVIIGLDRLGRSTAQLPRVVEQLPQERNIAYTAVMSTMNNLRRDGFVGRDRDGRAYRYYTLTSRAEYRTALMQQVLGAEAEHSVLSGAPAAHTRQR
jgi:predicted transcriptional regulator